jgi:CrcB protein
MIRFDKRWLLLFRRYLRRIGLKNMQTFLLISFGAIIGANCRYWLSGLVADRFGVYFPYGNLVINLTGSFLLGLFMALITDRFLIDPRWRIFISIGFLGSFTTFSSYTYESISLIQGGQKMLGLINLFGSSLLGGIAVTLGLFVGRWI